MATGPGVRTTVRHLLEDLGTGGTPVALAVEQAWPVGVVMGRFYRRLTDRHLTAEAEGISLVQELYPIGEVNEQADRLGDPYRHIEIRELPLDLGVDLDPASKLDRRPAFLRRLFDAGRTQAEGFLAGLPD